MSCWGIAIGNLDGSGAVYVPPTPPSKVCKKCGVPKILSDYYFKDNKWGGTFSACCKECERKATNAQRRLKRANQSASNSITPAQPAEGNTA